MTEDVNIVNQFEADLIDVKIVNSLTKNSKKPLRKLALEVGVSFVTVMNRIKKLEKAGVVEGYVAKINYEKLGYDVHMLLGMRIKKGKLLDLQRKIAQNPFISIVYDNTGDFDATIVGRFKTVRSMDRFLKKIQSYDFIEGMNTRLILNTIKEEQIEL